MTESTLCQNCDGTGLVWRHIKSFSGRRGVDFQEFCAACQGSGRQPVEDATTGTFKKPRRQGTRKAS